VKAVCCDTEARHTHTATIKKPYLDASDLKNYRPVSNPAFISKIVEIIVAEKLVSYLQENDLLRRLQSTYRRHHSTETALLRALSDIYAAADRKDVTLLGLLDLSAAFDCIDHNILVHRLQQSFGICGIALTWLQSLLHGRTQQVCFNGQLSTVVQLRFDVPQGLFSAHCCSCCRLRSCSISSRVPDSSDSCMPTTRQCSSLVRVNVHSTLHLLH